MIRASDHVLGRCVCCGLPPRSERRAGECRGGYMPLMSAPQVHWAESCAFDGRRVVVWADPACVADWGSFEEFFESLVGGASPAGGPPNAIPSSAGDAAGPVLEYRSV